MREGLSYTKTNFISGKVWWTVPLAFWLIKKLPRAQFISSFPRSGSTWLRAMLVSITHPESNSNPDFFNRIYPGVTLTRLKKVYMAPQPRILSTHSLFRKDIERSVYVIRDGRDSVASFYHYSVTRNDINIPVGLWVSRYLKGDFGPRWDTHINSWLGTGKQCLGESILVIRFEELLANTKIELANICQFLGIEYDESALNTAIESSSIPNMKKWEQSEGHNSEGNASFYRKGTVGDWKNTFSDAEIKKIMECSEDALRLAGYI